MTPLYRIFTLIINLFAFIFALVLLLIVPVSLAVPPLWLPVFLCVGIVLYTWFSNKFQRLVLVRQEVVKASLKDWIKVNGYVAIVFSFLNIPPMFALIKSPSTYIATMMETLKQFGPQYQQTFNPKTFVILAVIMIIYLLVLVVHVFWTFTLLKKHEDHFQQSS